MNRNILHQEIPVNFDVKPLSKWTIWAVRKKDRKSTESHAFHHVPMNSLNSAVHKSPTL